MANKKESQVKRNSGCSSEARYSEDRRAAIGFGHRITGDLEKSTWADVGGQQSSWRELYQCVQSLKNSDCGRTGPEAGG